MEHTTYEVLGLGNPIVDYILFVNEADLANFPGLKGGMEIVDFPTVQKIISTYPIVHHSAGGSATNTIKGLSYLGTKCGMIGKIGNDPEGLEFISILKEKGIVPLYQMSSIPTGRAACLITPDGQRTFRTYPGPMSTFTPDDLDFSAFKGVRLIYLEGYNLLNKGVTERCMSFAKQVGAKIAFDLASMEMVLNYKEEIVRLLSLYVDILFTNEEESLALTQSPPARACQLLKDLCKTVVIHDPKGCWIGEGNLELFVPNTPITPLDSTGAGDLFTSGFLYGYLNGWTLEQSVALGNKAGREVVQILGADLPAETWRKISKSELNTKTQRH